MAERTRADQVRDLSMIIILVPWLVFAIAAVVQLFTTGAKVLDSLPPYWFWGIPAFPYTAMYAPWRQILPGGTPPNPPPPTPPTPPGPPAPEAAQ